MLFSAAKVLFVCKTGASLAKNVLFFLGRVLFYMLFLPKSTTIPAIVLKYSLIKIGVNWSWSIASCILVHIVVFIFQRIINSKIFDRETRQTMRAVSKLLEKPGKCGLRCVILDQVKVKFTSVYNCKTKII